MRTGTPLWVTETSDIAGVGDAFAQPYNQVSDPTGERESAVLRAARPRIRTSGSTRRRSQRRPRPARSATRRATAIYNPGQYQWDIALFKNVAVKGTQNIQFRAEIFNFPNHPNLSGAHERTRRTRRSDASRARTTRVVTFS